MGTRSTSRGAKPPKTAPSQATRGVRVRGRSERVVQAVLQAAVSEIAERGYVGFRLDEVAQAAGVNRTSIYRRWPTKAQLVEAALRVLGLEFSGRPASGDTAADLLSMLERFVRWQRTPRGKGMYRMIQLDAAEPELARIIARLRIEFLRPWSDTLDDAKQRGEIDPSLDSLLLMQMILAPAMVRVEHGEPVTRRTLATLVRVTLAGARLQTAARQPRKGAFGSRKAKPAPKGPKRKRIATDHRAP